MLCGVENQTEPGHRHDIARASHNAALHVIKPVEGSVGVAETRLLDPAFRQAVLATRQFVGDERRDEIEGGHALGRAEPHRHEELSRAHWKPGSRVPLPPGIGRLARALRLAGSAPQGSGIT